MVILRQPEEQGRDVLDSRGVGVNGLRSWVMVAEPITVVIDNCSLDPILDGDRLERWKAAIAEGRLEVLCTHVTIDEAGETPNEARRADLLRVVQELCGTVVPTDGIVFDVSRLDRAAFSSDDTAIPRFGRGKPKHVKDALICATAESRGCMVLSEDGPLRKRASDRGLPVVTVAELDELLQPD